MTYAKVIADSMSPEGVRLTTMEVRFHRFVLAEFNTHRDFSRNSASSRAIPVGKQIQRVREDPAIPLSWPMEQKGMQGGDEIIEQSYAQDVWEQAAHDAANYASDLARVKVHKSVTNRLLEPFMWHTVVVTSTYWENFFKQRCSPLAQPEIRAAADLMRDAYDESFPTLQGEGQWHTPYIGPEDVKAVTATLDLDPKMYSTAKRLIAKVSAARCARVSYLTQDGKRDIHEDLALFKRLETADPPHLSPLEHVATPWSLNRNPGHTLTYWDNGKKYIQPKGFHRPQVGNLLGWRSLRTEHEMVPE